MYLLRRVDLKNPWMAALGNLVPLPVGLGYLYLGKKGKAFAVFVLGWVVTLGIGVAALFTWVLCELGSDDCEIILSLVLLILFFVVPVGFLIYAAQDAWRIAKRMNGQITG